MQQLSKISMAAAKEKKKTQNVFDRWKSDNNLNLSHLNWLYVMRREQNYSFVIDYFLREVILEVIRML